MDFPLIDPASAQGQTKELLDTTQRQLGRVPNLYRAMANAPAALDGYLAMRNALVKGQLNVQDRERLALLVAQENGCAYCVSAHTLRGSKIGLTEEDLVRTRAGESDDPRTAALLKFTQEVVRRRGSVSEDTRDEAEAAGLTAVELGEAVAHVALNVLSNYFNHVAEPELDFPLVEA